MGGAPNELVLRFWTLSLSAKGMPAAWLVIPVSAILVALAWRIAAAKRGK